MPQWEWRREQDAKGNPTWVCEQASGLRAVVAVDGAAIHKLLEKTLSHERLVDEQAAPGGRDALEPRVEQAKRELETRLATLEDGHS